MVCFFSVCGVQSVMVCVLSQVEGLAEQVGVEHPRKLISFTLTGELRSFKKLERIGCTLILSKSRNSSYFHIYDKSCLLNLFLVLRHNTDDIMLLFYKHTSFLIS